MGRPERVHPKTPYKWIKREIPRSPWRSLAALVLSKELGRPITVTDRGWQPDDLECTSATAGLQTPWTATGTLRAVQAVTDAGPMDRRHFLLLTGASITAPAHEWLIAHPAGHTTRAAGTSVPAAVVDHLDQITAQLRRLDDQIGGGQLLHLVHEHLRYVTSLLRERRYDDTIGRRLYATAAELLRRAGFVAFDDGQHGRAQRYWIAGLRAAHTAGDQATGANILGFMSCQAKDLTGGREAALLAETARTGYPGASSKVTAILALRAAEASAHDQSATPARRTADTRRAIDTAFDALTGGLSPSSGDPEWSYWMDPAQAHAQAGYCHLRIGDHPQARYHLRRALRLQDTSYSREGALRQILLATTHLQQQQPDIDPALAHAGRAIDALCDHVDSARCRGHVSHLTHALTPYRRSTGVRGFLDRARPLLSPA
ncbi:MAG: hypothetical protein ACRDTA_10025 [Pseudonocardiaceae bacterium]